MAASIGADTVTKAAQAIESVLKSHESGKAMELLEHLAGPVAALVQSIEQEQGHAKATPGDMTSVVEAGPLDMNALGELVATLHQLLSEDDAQAIKHLPPVEAMVQGSKHKTAFADIANLTRDYDLGAALRALQAWKLHAGLERSTK